MSSHVPASVLETKAHGSASDSARDLEDGQDYVTNHISRCELVLNQPPDVIPVDGTSLHRGNLVFGRGKSAAVRRSIAQTIKLRRKHLVGRPNNLNTHFPQLPEGLKTSRSLRKTALTCMGQTINLDKVRAAGIDMQLPVVLSSWEQLSVSAKLHFGIFSSSLDQSARVDQLVLSRMSNISAHFDATAVWTFGGYIYIISLKVDNKIIDASTLKVLRRLRIHITDGPKDFKLNSAKYDKVPEVGTRRSLNPREVESHLPYHQDDLLLTHVASDRLQAVAGPKNNRTWMPPGLFFPLRPYGRLMDIERPGTPFDQYFRWACTNSTQTSSRVVYDWIKFEIPRATSVTDMPGFGGRLNEEGPHNSMQCTNSTETVTTITSSFQGSISCFQVYFGSQPWLVFEITVPLADIQGAVPPELQPMPTSQVRIAVPCTKIVTWLNKNGERPTTMMEAAQLVLCSGGVPLMMASQKKNLLPNLRLQNEDFLHATQVPGLKWKKSGRPNKTGKMILDKQTFWRFFKAAAERDRARWDEIQKAMASGKCTISFSEGCEDRLGPLDAEKFHYVNGQLYSRAIGEHTRIVSAPEPRVEAWNEDIRPFQFQPSPASEDAPERLVLDSASETDSPQSIGTKLELEQALSDEGNAVNDDPNRPKQDVTSCATRLLEDSKQRQDWAGWLYKKPSIASSGVSSHGDGLSNSHHSTNDPVQGDVESADTSPSANIRPPNVNDQGSPTCKSGRNHILGRDYFAVPLRPHTCNGNDCALQLTDREAVMLIPMLELARNSTSVSREEADCDIASFENWLKKGLIKIALDKKRAPANDTTAQPENAGIETRCQESTASQESTTSQESTVSQESNTDQKVYATPPPKNRAETQIRASCSSSAPSQSARVETTCATVAPKQHDNNNIRFQKRGPGPSKLRNEVKFEMERSDN